MKNYGNTTKFISCIVVLTVYSCSPIYRFNRLVKCHPYLLDRIESDTVIVDSGKSIDTFFIFKTEFIFMSCGDFDGNQMAREAIEKKITIPNYLQRWINLKKAFPKDVNKKDLKEDSNNWNTVNQQDKAKPCGGMTAMLEALKLPLEGKHHSGIDDARNIAKIVLTLQGKDFEFNQAMVNNSKKMIRI